VVDDVVGVADDVVGVGVVAFAGNVLVVPLLAVEVRPSDSVSIALIQVGSLLEEWMAQCLLGSDSFLWVHSQHLFQQIKPLFIYFPKVPPIDGLQIVNVGELHPNKFRVFEEVLVVL
jgi:hypothetical protein